MILLESNVPLMIGIMFYWVLYPSISIIKTLIYTFSRCLNQLKSSKDSICNELCAICYLVSPKEGPKDLRP